MTKGSTFIEFIQQKYLRAVEKGSILQFECNSIGMTDKFLTYTVKHCPILEHKPVSPNVFRDKTGGYKSPFLEIPKDMKVADYPDHVLIFNKYPIFPHHLLLVTRTFRPQYEDLDEADFTAISMVLSELSSPFLLFYNCGPESGASQLHKHIQFIPFESWNEIPIYDSVTGSELVHFDFWHWSTMLEGVKGPARFDRNILFSQYQQLMKKMKELFGSQNSLISYNLLMTDKWMLLIPRMKECFATSISINSMAFCGFLLAKSNDEIEIIRHNGISKILQAVSLSC